MIAVKAVSNYSARADDQIDVTEGQIFYVLSVTADERKYFVSSSPRVPFSRLAKSGYAPVPLFVIVGDTLPPAVCSKVKMLISDSNAPKPNFSGPKIDKRTRFAGAPLDAAGDNENLDGAPDQEQRKGISHSISAAARHWLGGIMGRPSRDEGLAVNGGDASWPGNGSQRPSHPAAVPWPLPALVVNVQIVTYAKRKAGVVYKIKFTLADGTGHFVRRTYDDIQKLDAKIRQGFAEMPSLPPPASVKEQDAAVATRGKELNIYLQGVVRIHLHLISLGAGVGLHEEICGALCSPQGQDAPAAAGSQDAQAAAGSNKHLPFGFALPAGMRPRPSADSPSAGRPPSRKDSVQAESSSSLPAAAPEDKQHYGVVNADSGKQAALAAPEGLLEDAAAGGFAAMMARRLERLTNLNRAQARV